MNVAVILAGGVGSRLGADIPKQYLKVEGKPIIVYTLEKFQSSDAIDAVEVVCAAEYIEYIRTLCEEYGLSKVKWINRGGSTCQDSIRNGVYALRDEISDEDILMLHMSVSPLVSEETIREGIRIAAEKGNSMPVQPCLFCMAKKMNNEGWTDQNAYKEEYMGLNMPWTFVYKNIYSLYRRAESEHKGEDIKSYTPTLMFDYGEPVYYFDDNEENRLKITTRFDLALFEAYVKNGK